VATGSLIVFEPPQVVQQPGFDFNGLVRHLTARVVDDHNRTYAKAPAGANLSSIRLEGDFGKPESAVTLTFYRRVSVRRGHRARGAVTQLKALARFDPFVVKRGHVVIRLKVPRTFSPTHIGVTVQEVARGKAQPSSRGTQPCTKVKPQKPLRFSCLGPKRGVIAPVLDAARLHKRKSGRPRRT
jgi:hypothetical protein